MRRTATAAIILTTGLLFSACSSEEDGEATDTSSSTPSSASESTSEEATPSEDTEGEDGGSGDIDPADIPALALTAENFPAPYTFTELPPGALEQGGEAIGGVLAGAEYDPAECGNASQATQGADLSEAGVALGLDQSGGTTVTSVLSPEVEQDVDFEEIAETCANFTFSLNGPDGAPLEGEATLELLPEPDVEADDARAVQTSVTISLGGQEQTVDTVIYAAELRGVSVVSSGTGLTGGTVDNAVLEDLLVAGLDKVRSAP